MTSGLMSLVVDDLRCVEGKTQYAAYSSASEIIILFESLL